MGSRVTRMTTKGQVVIPKELRDESDLATGDSISLAIKENDISLVKRSGWAKATAGCLPSSLPPIEPEELDEMAEHAADEEIREKYGITR